MAHLMLAGLVSPLTRQLSHLGKYVAGYASPAAVAIRSISTISGIRSRSLPAFEPPRTIRCPLLGQCQQLQCVQSFLGMKTKSCLKKRCKDCFFVRRRGRLFVFCKTHPRHKQRQG